MNDPRLEAMGDTPAEWLDALNRAATYYREALKHVIEECSNDEPRIAHIREAAERGIRAADYELRAVDGR